MSYRGDDWEPKRIVFPVKETKQSNDSGDHLPKPIVFAPKQKVEFTGPKPIAFSAKPTSVKNMADESNQKPKTISFGNTPSKAAQVDPASAPKAASFGSPPAQPKPNTPTASPSRIDFNSAPKTVEQQLENRMGVKIKTPEEAKFERMIYSAQSHDAVVAAKHGFVAVLSSLDKLTPRDVINWGASNMQTNKLMTDKLAEITRDLTFLSPSQWIDEAKTESTKVPDKGIFGMFKNKGNTPEFYEQKLVQIRKSLDELISVKLDKAAKEFEGIPDRFDMEILALKVWVEKLTNATEMQIADNRLRIMISAQQGILMNKQMLANLQLTVTNSIQQIDELTMTVIPNWKIAHAHSK